MQSKYLFINVEPSFYISSAKRIYMTAHKADYVCKKHATAGFLVEFSSESSMDGLIQYGDSLKELSKYQSLTYKLKHFISSTDASIMCIKIEKINDQKDIYLRKLRRPEERSHEKPEIGSVRIRDFHCKRMLAETPPRTNSLKCFQENPCLHTYNSMAIDDFAKNILTKSESDALYARYHLADDLEKKDSCMKLATSYISYCYIVHRNTPRLSEVGRYISSYLLDSAKPWDDIKDSVKKKIERLNKNSLRRRGIEKIFPNLQEAIDFFGIQGELNQLSLQIMSNKELMLKEIIEVADHPVEEKKSYSFLFYNKNKTLNYDNMELFADGTNHYVPIKGAQLFVISGKRPNEVSFPIVYFISKRKTAQTYDALFSRFSEMASKQRLKLHCDFEMAIMAAAEQYFQVIPCYFHVNQAFFSNKIQLERLNALLEKFLSSKTTIDNIYCEITALFADRKENRMIVRRKFLNLLKLLMFVQPNHRRHMISSIGERNLNELEKNHLKSAAKFIKTYERFFPLNPSFSLTNNIAEVFFSNFKSNFERKPTLFVFLKMIQTIDRLKSDYRKANSVMITDSFSEIATCVYEADDVDAIVSVLDRVWKWKNPTFDIKCGVDEESSDDECHEVATKENRRIARETGVDVRTIGTEETLNRKNTLLKRTKTK